MTELKRSLTLADIDAAERKWRELLEAKLKRELDATVAEAEQQVDDAMWRARFKLDEAYQRDMEAQSGCYDPEAE